MTSPAELKTTLVNGDGMFYDVLLEALSYLEDSAWPGFEDAFESVSAAHESPDESARDAARKLAVLGHIDVLLNRFTLRAEKWSVSPSALLRLREGEMVLCGRRPAALLASLGA